MAWSYDSWETDSSGLSRSISFPACAPLSRQQPTEASGDAAYLMTIVSPRIIKQRWCTRFIRIRLTKDIRTVIVYANWSDDAATKFFVRQKSKFSEKFLQPITKFNEWIWVNEKEISN